jgi:uncharacterized damage-inducible protein DinB
MRRLLAVLIAAAVPALCVDDSTLVSTLVKHWKTSKAYTIAIAEKMPEDGYASKPNPAQMTFAAQMEHIATANAFFFARITDGKSPLATAETHDKASVIKMLNASFDYAIKSVAALTPAQLDGLIDLEGGKMTGLEGVMLAMDHTAHHRGQCIVYLRVRNIAPPQYQF